MSRLDGWPGDARLYRLQSPDGGSVGHVLVVAGELEMEDGRRLPLAVVWPASERGEVVARALAAIHVPDHERALRRAGIEPVAAETWCPHCGFGPMEVVAIEREVGFCPRCAGPALLAEAAS
ncbi:MAG TPA: hypothetical protein VFD01_08025 [Candidatus Dormibacteraeota bacterium]|nr:hypothetical protein [Candidatus Dormibacteraeota bacterium]